MIIPPRNHKAWSDIVTGKIKYEFEFLAAKMLLGRLMLDIERDHNPDTVQKCANELRDLYINNAHFPSVQRDLIKIFNQ